MTTEVRARNLLKLVDELTKLVIELPKIRVSEAIERETKDILKRLVLQALYDARAEVVVYGTGTHTYVAVDSLYQMILGKLPL